MVHLIRKGLRTFYYGPPSELKKLYSALTRFLEGAFFSKLYKDKIWDGNVHFYDKSGGWFWFGLIEYVLEAFSKSEIDYKLEGYEEAETDWIEFSKNFLGDDRDYQREAIRSFLERKYGTIKVPTRGGKTFIASEIIRLLNSREEDVCTLFVVDSDDLFHQAIADISGILNIRPEDIGRLKADVFELKQVNVAMIQTIQSALTGKSRKKNPSIEDKRSARLRKRLIEKLLSQVGFLIIDEVQEFGRSKARLSVIRRCSEANHILSVSATPYKYEDEIHKLNVESFSGGIVYDISEKRLVSKGVLAENRTLILMKEYDPKPYEMVGSYRDIVNDVIINNDSRNELICSVAKVCEKLGIKTLIIFNSVEHGKLISERSGLEFLSGEHSSKNRRISKENFLSKRGGVFLVSDIWKKGITLPSVEILFNVDGGKEDSLVIQRRGRVLGVTEKKKKALCIDIVDDFPKYLDEHGVKRIQAYAEKTGMDKIDMIETDDPDSLSQIEEYLINWFELNIQ